jgi:hypothetical protein
MHSSQVLVYKLLVDPGNENCSTSVLSGFQCTILTAVHAAAAAAAVHDWRADH